MTFVLILYCATPSPYHVDTPRYLKCPTYHTYATRIAVAGGRTYVSLRPVADQSKAHPHKTHTIAQHPSWLVDSSLAGFSGWAVCFFNPSTVQSRRLHCCASLLCTPPRCCQLQHNATHDRSAKEHRRQQHQCRHQQRENLCMSAVGKSILRRPLTRGERGAGELARCASMSIISHHSCTLR